jgi:hypothetical protein
VSKTKEEVGELYPRFPAQRRSNVTLCSRQGSQFSDLRVRFFRGEALLGPAVPADPDIFQDALRGCREWRRRDGLFPDGRLSLNSIMHLGRPRFPDGFSQNLIDRFSVCDVVPRRVAVTLSPLGLKTPEGRF